MFKLRCLKTNNFWHRCLIDLSWFRPPKMEPKSHFRCTFFENANLATIIVFRKGNCYFSWFRASEISTKLTQQRDQTLHRNNCIENRNSAPIFGSFGKLFHNFSEIFQRKTKTHFWTPRALLQPKPHWRGLELCDCLPGLPKD